MKIQLKRSNVLENGKAKEPTPSQMEYGEVAVNYNTKDPTLFIKDSSGTIVAITNFDTSDIDEVLDEITSLLPSPLEEPAFQENTLDERYISRFSWSNLPDFSTASSQ